MALTYTPASELGQKCPDFILPAVDGKTFSLKNFVNGQPLVVMFICNHCPYVKAIEDRLIALGHDLKKMDINLVAICSNDPQNYPEDSFENLKKRWTEKNYSFPYLHDADQKVAHAFGAVCTPDYFVYNSDLVLSYRGRLDDSWKDPSQVTRRELLQAVTDLKNKKPISFTPTPSMGCSIKWIRES